jgi:hypothetical protein
MNSIEQRPRNEQFVAVNSIGSFCRDKVEQASDPLLSFQLFAPMNLSETVVAAAGEYK